MSFLQPLPISLFALAALTAFGPLSVDAYLPAMPTIAKQFGVSIHQVELSLSLYLAGFALGQLIGGPYSDKYGRRYGVLTGTLIFFIGCVIVGVSYNIPLLWIGRFIQAVGGGLAVVNSSAIIRDVADGKDSARLLAHMAIIIMLAPLLAPSIGTLFLEFSGWRSIFTFLALYGLIICVLFYFKLTETRQIAAQKLRFFDRYLMVLTHRRALSYILSQCLAYAGMFAFITASPLVYMQVFGVSTTLYPFLFGINILCMVIANRINVFLLRYYSPPTLLSIGQTMQCLTGVGILLYVSLVKTPELWHIVTLIMLFVGTHGFITPNATASTVEFFPTNSGTATALIGALSFFVGAISSMVVGFLGDGTAWPMAVVMASCAAISLPLRFLLRGDDKATTAALAKNSSQ